MSYGLAQALVQNSTGQDATTSLSTPNFGSNNAAGNLIFAAAFFDGNSGSVPNPSSITLTDTLGNTYQQIATLVDATNHFVTAIFYAKNIKGGANAVTATYNGSFAGGTFYKAVMAAEYSGLDTAAPFVTGEYSAHSDRPSSGGGTDSLSSGNTPTLSGQSCAVIGFNVILHNSNGPSAAGTGFTDRSLAGFWSFGSGAQFAKLEDKLATTTSAVAATFSSALVANYDTYVAVFHEPAIAVASAPSDTTSASGTLVASMSLAEWNVGTAQLPQLQRRIFFDDGHVKCLVGGNVCLLHEIYPVTLGSGTLTIEDQNGAVVFTATTTQMSQGVVISVDKTGAGILTVTSFPTGGEYGMSWQQSA